MSTILLVAATWGAFTTLLVLAVCRAAARGERAAV